LLGRAGGRVGWRNGKKGGREGGVKTPGVRLGVVKDKEFKAAGGGRHATVQEASPGDGEGRRSASLVLVLGLVGVTVDGG